MSSKRNASKFILNIDGSRDLSDPWAGFTQFILEDRSLEETEWQERWAREAAWKLAKSVLKLKGKNKATFFSPSENRCLPASTLKPEERELLWTPERRCI